MLKGVATVSVDLLNAASKVVPVTVQSAVALTDAQKERIVKALPKYSTSPNLNIEFEVRCCAASWSDFALCFIMLESIVVSFFSLVFLRLSRPLSVVC